ncbi:HAD family hydrolase [uncultured Bifidobacterium sp.]|uniref:HAD family hydrolase n=1 Tax=uncultured Bifidobacterium sp. TaxID=165187 RepID=UPI00261D1BC0|nr:HAD family hydrolase [uncultured Bifidobacterium sp.]
MDDMRFTVAFDFDGTVCLGDGPVRAYAQEASQYLDAVAAGRLHDELSRYLRCPKSMPEYSDPYDAVAACARGKMAPEQLQDAYLYSRQQLRLGTVDVRMPDGLPDFLAELGGMGCSRMLVTNSPIIGLKETLRRFGVEDQFDGLLPDAHKPTGWHGIVRRLIGGGSPCADEPRIPSDARMMGIGDYWANDIEPLNELGQLTAFVHEPDSRYPATVTAPTLPEMYADIIKLVQRCQTAKQV